MASILYIQRGHFLATLVALHLTPVGKSVSEWVIVSDRTSVAWSLRACSVGPSAKFVLAITDSVSQKKRPILRGKKKFVHAQKKVMLGNGYAMCFMQNK